MDLGKALRAKIDGVPRALKGAALAAEFLVRLADAIDKDIFVLSKDADLNAQGFSRIRLHKGMFEADRKNLKPSERNQKQNQPPYIFLHLTDRPGLLLEVVEDKLHLLRATKVVPLLADNAGAPMRPTLIVGQGQSLEEFEVLDEDTARTLYSGKTLSLEQTSEMMLLLAFDELAKDRSDK